MNDFLGATQSTPAHRLRTFRQYPNVVRMRSNVTPSTEAASRSPSAASETADSYDVFDETEIAKQSGSTTPTIQDGFQFHPKGFGMVITRARERERERELYRFQPDCDLDVDDDGDLREEIDDSVRADVRSE